jgi:hypothetical protein
MSIRAGRGNYRRSFMFSIGAMGSTLPRDRDATSPVVGQGNLNSVTVNPSLEVQARFDWHNVIYIVDPD